MTQRRRPRKTMAEMQKRLRETMAEMQKCRQRKTIMERKRFRRKILPETNRSARKLYCPWTNLFLILSMGRDLEKIQTVRIQTVPRQAAKDLR